jgi:saccharopine dehydrogenase-like NADP-dependent oxidoreductase
MKAALEGNCHYLDLGGLYHMTKEQLPLSDHFKAKKLTAVAGMGATPGTTNVMTEAACRELDTIKSIDIACGGAEFVVASNHPFDPPYMLDTMLDEYTKDAMVFENGKMSARSPLAEHKTIEFPDPVGSQSAIYTLHSELATMPENYKAKGVRGVTFRLALPKELHEKFKLFCELGFGGTEPVTTPEGTFTPRKLLAHMIGRIPSMRGEPDDCEMLLIDVKGSKAGNDVLIRMLETAHADKERKISAGDLNTGVPPSIVAQMLVRGDVKEHGVLPPELCIDPDLYFEELKKRKIDVTKTVRQAISS